MDESKIYYNDTAIKGHIGTSNAVVHAGMVTMDTRGVFGLLRRMTVTELVEKKKLKEAIRGELKIVRKEMMDEAKAVLPNDPRKAYRAIKYNLYGRGTQGKSLGGNVSILQKKKAGKLHDIPRVRGKITRNRKKTPGAKTLDRYYGPDRGFILRWMNSGTERRDAGKCGCFSGGMLANRGRITARPFFEKAKTQINKAAIRLDGKITKLVEEVTK